MKNNGFSAIKSVSYAVKKMEKRIKNKSVLNLWKYFFYIFSYIPVEEDDTIPTAKIHQDEFSKKIKISISRNFVENLAVSWEDIAFALIHEITHYYLNHLNNQLLGTLGASDILINIIADIDVNNFIDRFGILTPMSQKVMYIDKISRMKQNMGRSAFFLMYMVCTSVIKRVYGNLENFIEKEGDILNPKDRRHWIVFKHRLEDGKYGIKDIIDEVEYWDANVDTDALIHLVLFGSYDDIEDIIGKILAGMPNPYGRNAGYGEDIYSIKYSLKKVQWELTKVLVNAFERDKNTISFHRKNEKSRTVVPVNMGRREVLLLRMGINPVFYPVYRNKIKFTQGGVNIYIDVSRSIMDYIPFIFGAIYPLRDYIGKGIYEFSNKVVKVEWEDIKKGISHTTGGTDMDCVLRHMLKYHHKRAVMFTDAMFGFPDLTLVHKMEKEGRKLYFVIIRDIIENEGANFDIRLRKIIEDCWTVKPKDTSLKRCKIQR